jgi:hypothetical protein
VYYHSKVQPTAVHRALRPIYLYEEGKSPSTLQGCDKILESLATGTKTKATITSQHLNTTAPKWQLPQGEPPTVTTKSGVIQWSS